jgi:hypothetical protein
VLSDRLVHQGAIPVLCEGFVASFHSRPFEV